MHKPKVNDIYIGLNNDRYWKKGKLYIVVIVNNPEIFSLKPLIGTFPDDIKHHSLYTKSCNPHNTDMGIPLVKPFYG